MDSPLLSRLILVIGLVSLLLCAAIFSLQAQPQTEPPVDTDEIETSTSRPFNDLIAEREPEVVRKPGPLTIDELQYALNSLDNNNALSEIGGYTLDFEQRNKLTSSIYTIEEQEYSVGVVMMDITTGYGLAYNVDEQFYSASTIKAFCVASLAAELPETIQSQSWIMRAAVEDSDNDAYDYLRLLYGDEHLAQWFDDAGVDASISSEWYPYYSARDLAKLWLRTYEYFVSEGEEVDEVRSWFSSTYNSSISQTLGPAYAVSSKAGWISDEEYSVSVDAGIVYAHNCPYLLVIMTGVPADMALLDPLVLVLDEIHEAMN